MTAMPDKRLVVCVNDRLGYAQKSCAGSGSRAMIKILKNLVADNGIQFEILEQVCLGRCEEGITMRIAPGGPFFTHVKKRDLKRIIQVLNDFEPLHGN